MLNRCGGESMEAEMDVKERMAGDLEGLRTLAASERNAKQRDRLRAVALALDGELTEEIMTTLDRSKNFVQRWVYAYRDGGIEAIRAKKQTGRKRKLTKQQSDQLAERLDAGATEKDAVCTLRGEDIRAIIQEMFDTSYSLNGVYALLHAMGYSRLRPRPRHEKNNPAAMEEWKKAAPLLSSASASSTPARKSRSGGRTKPASDRRAR